jgi:hypothetical protein
VRISAVRLDDGAGGRASSDDVGSVLGAFAVFVAFVAFVVFVELRFRVAMR